VTSTLGAQPAGLARRLGASVYEGLVLTALALGVGFALLPVLNPGAGAAVPATPFPPLYLPSPGARVVSGAMLFAVCAAYCSWLWSDGRQTLPMRTWRLGLRTRTGLSVPPQVALTRFLACWMGPALAVAAYAALRPSGNGRWTLVLLAFNYAWAFFDRDRQFLQDRLAGTRLVRANAPGARADA
jgi:hypothetical protein